MAALVRALPVSLALSAARHRVAALLTRPRVGIVALDAMPVLANLGAPSHLLRVFAPQQVLSHRDGFNVMRVHAASNAAQMVQVDGWVQRMIQLLPQPAMRLNVWRADPGPEHVELPVALRREPFGPQPAGAEFRGVRRHWAILVDLWPEAVKRVFGAGSEFSHDSNITYDRPFITRRML